MKATLLKSLFYLLSVFSVLGFAAYAVGAGAPAGHNGAPKQTKSSADSKIEIENWAKPEPGWLYVLDPKPDAGGQGGRIWLFDPETAKVMGSIRTGDNPDFALSPDGSRLYVAAITEGDSSELAVIDTAQGVVLQRGTIEDREVANVLQMNVLTQEFSETSAHSVLPNRVPPAAWPSSPDGSRIYLGYVSDYDRHYDNRFYLDYGRPPNLRPNNETAGEFRVLDTHTWKKIGTIKTKMPFWSAVIANDGKVLYAMAPQKHSILVIDTGKMRQIRILKVGGAPTLALVAP